MAHQVYGETENIFGYKDLNINVYYSAGPLDIYYDVKYSKKVGTEAFHQCIVNNSRVFPSFLRSMTSQTTMD